MTEPRIVPTPFPLRQQPGRRIEQLAWQADKLREAFDLGGRPFADMSEANQVHTALGHPPIPLAAAVDITEPKER